MSGLTLGKLVPKIIFERRFGLRGYGIQHTNRPAGYATNTQPYRATLLAQTRVTLNGTVWRKTRASGDPGRRGRTPGAGTRRGSHGGAFIVAPSHVEKTPNERASEDDADGGAGHKIRQGGVGDRPGALMINEDRLGAKGYGYSTIWDEGYVDVAHPQKSGFFGALTQLREAASASDVPSEYISSILASEAFPVQYTGDWDTVRRVWGSPLRPGGRVGRRREVGTGRGQRAFSSAPAAHTGSIPCKHKGARVQLKNCARSDRWSVKKRDPAGRNGATACGSYVWRSVLDYIYVTGSWPVTEQECVLKELDDVTADDEDAVSTWDRRVAACEGFLAAYCGFSPPPALQVEGASSCRTSCS
ncbi:hypothetical protein T492DRAFT_850004 [Pavlovales sp. CCMP2436]|nr:hypothetical protein T492DRAFT_850004 [Pavlovales sp. CCMP2436]